MTDQAILTNKIRSYLQALSPRAVETLVRGLEKARDSGTADPHVELILAASSSILRAGAAVGSASQANEIARRNHLQRLFFSPVDTFVINEQLPRKQEGRVYRPYLTEIWNWLERDVLPDDFRKVRGAFEKPTVDDEKAARLAARLREKALEAMLETMARVEQSERERRRLGMVIGGERAIQDLSDVTKVFKAEPWLMPFLNQMPPSLSERRLKQDTDVLNLVGTYSSRHPDAVPMIAAAVLDRADAPSSLGAFALRLGHAKDAKDLGKTPFAPFVDMVISEAERLNVLARQHQKHNPDPVAFSEAVSSYANLIRGLDLDLDLADCDEWRGRIAETRRDVSHIVTNELQGACGAVRRALQVPHAGKDGTLEVDQRAVDDAVRALRVVSMARGSAETLAVNEVGKRTRQTVEQTLEIVTRSLLSDLRKQKGDDREAHAAAVDVAIQLSEIYFGADYASQLRRSRQNAMADEEKKTGT
ncbi:hypothetical protein [Polymorphum gilvum]|uniref:Uncharacterized protein n=1 Tax=Polymorphum gilvum (strain LMG 25793 / CGMCC 1.9160 / SL003B-26A1) TaxID=991905 RepID=F2J6F9_POLGS|nr:hypothetical protein [Polymorphum gilvum]ADZ71333.1 hypothetical protein SL003B_2910 [Polymorphum gilvum SL003B-26A1]